MLVRPAAEEAAAHEHNRGVTRGLAGAVAGLGPVRPAALAGRRPDYSHLCAVALRVACVRTATTALPSLEDSRGFPHVGFLLERQKHTSLLCEIERGRSTLRRGDM